MKLHSFNEWDKLREIVVGTANNANWPVRDPVFIKESEKTTWHETPVPMGPVPKWIVDETNEDLEGLVSILQNAGVIVHRPNDMDFVSVDGMSNYCPRDRLLIAGDCIVDGAMMYPCRDQEIKNYEFLTQDNKILTMPRSSGMIMDAANICRLNDNWLFLKSPSGSQLAFDWLCQQFPEINIEWCDMYNGVHIDSTIVPLREGVVMLNASRVRPDNVPRCLEKWDKIWVDDCVPQSFYQYPYSSKWLGMNTLSIDPDTVIVDGAQIHLIKILESKGFTVIPHVLRHGRTLGGGFHCVTLDTWRQNH